ncbi:MAG: hypothetical protein AAF849_10165 [Bacteroidota bacterium]
MTTHQFIHEAFDKIQSLFPIASLEYQYKEYSSTHFVKVSPSYLVDTDEFLELDIAITDELEAMRADEMFCFITEDSLVEIGRPSLIASSKFYSLNLEMLEESFVDETLYTDYQEPKFDFVLSKNAGNRQYAMAA